MPKIKETYDKKIKRWLNSAVNKEAYQLQEDKEEREERLFCKAC